MSSTGEDKAYLVYFNRLIPALHLHLFPLVLQLSLSVCSSSSLHVPYMLLLVFDVVSMEA